MIAAGPDSSGRSLANAFCYTPDGKIEKLKLRNGLWEEEQYDFGIEVLKKFV